MLSCNRLHFIIFTTGAQQMTHSCDLSRHETETVCSNNYWNNWCPPGHSHHILNGGHWNGLNLAIVMSAVETLKSYLKKMPKYGRR